MADEDEKKSVSEDSTEVDESKTQDESVETQGAESIQTDSGGEQTEDETAEAGESTFERRFTQFKGDTIEEYVKNLEQGYENSSKEALKLKKERDDARSQKLAEVANTETGEAKKPESTQPQSMTDMWVGQEMKRRHTEQYSAFAEKHPEVNTDDDLFTRLDEETGKYMNYVYSTENRIPDLGESLDWAWKIVRPNDGESLREEKVVTAVKDAGSSAKVKSNAKDPQKLLFSDAQIEAARKFDPTLREKSRTEIEEILAKYKK